MKQHKWVGVDRVRPHNDHKRVARTKNQTKLEATRLIESGRISDFSSLRILVEGEQSRAIDAGKFGSAEIRRPEKREQ